VTIRGLNAALLAVATLVPVSPCDGQDFMPVRQTAIADTEQRAMQDAYYAAFDRALTKATAEQAAKGLGAKFRGDFDRDFNGFKSRYFTADTDHRCAQQTNGRYVCEVDGALRWAALRAALQEILDKQLSFALAFERTADRRKNYVVDQLAGAFAGYGLRILMGSAANPPLAKGNVDFGLGVYDVTFTNLDDPAAYDPYDLRLRGTLSLRFRVTLLKTGEVLRAEPVTVSNSEAGPYPAALKDKLMANLGKQAAETIARNVNAVVASYRAKDDMGAQK
jgi:hypothetical protein